MNIKARKTHLINWLTNLDNEALLNRIEELKQESQLEVPMEILSLLDTSNAVDSAKLIEHKKVRDLLKR